MEKTETALAYIEVVSFADFMPDEVKPMFRRSLERLQTAHVAKANRQAIATSEYKDLARALHPFKEAMRKNKK